MALLPEQRAQFIRYLRMLGNLSAFSKSSNDSDLFENVGPEEMKAFLSLFNSGESDQNFKEFSDLIDKKPLPEYEDLKTEYEALERKNNFDEAVGIFAGLNSHSPDLYKLKCDVNEAIDNPTISMPADPSVAPAPYAPIPTKELGIPIMEIIAGMSAGIAIKSAFSQTATSLCGSTIVGTFVLGTIAGAVIGGALGTFHAYANLSEDEKALSRLNKVAIAINKGGLHGAGTGAVFGFAGVGVGMGVSAALGTFAVGIVGATTAAIGLGGVSGAVIGLVSGFWKAYSTLTEEEKSKGLLNAVVISWNKDKAAIVKSGVMGFGLGLVGGAAGMLLAGNVNASCEKPAEPVDHVVPAADSKSTPTPAATIHQQSTPDNSYNGGKDYNCYKDYNWDNGRYDHPYPCRTQEYSNLVTYEGPDGFRSTFTVHQDQPIVIDRPHGPDLVIDGPRPSREGNFVYIIDKSCDHGYCGNDDCYANRPAHDRWIHNFYKSNGMC